MKRGRGDSGEGGSRRLPRVEKEIQQVIGAYLLGRFRGQLHGLVSVSRVIVSGDLRTAKVYVTVMGSEVDRETSLEELQSHAYEIQSEVNRQLRMKFCPRLSFFYDEGFDNSLRVEKILRDIGEERARKEKKEGAATGSASEDEENS